MINSNRQFQNFCEYQFKGNYNRCCNFPNPTSRTSLNNNKGELDAFGDVANEKGDGGFLQDD